MGHRRAPLITVPSDDFEIKIDEDVYHPHEGEVVTFKRKVSSSDLLMIASASELHEKGGAGDMARFFYEEACRVMQRAIFSWTWTDMYTGEPLGKPLGKKGEERVPSLEDIRELGATTELQYLLETWISTTRSTPEKN